MTRCCDMHAGKLREPVEFQRAEKVSDGAGGYTETWSALTGSSTRAQVKALSGHERFASERIEATTKYRVVVRYFPGLLERDRIVIRDRSHNIRFIDNLELRDMWLEISVDGGVAV